MNAAARRAAAGRDDGLLWQFLCLAKGPFLRFGLRFRPRRAQRWSSEERSNPEPRAARYSEHGEDCEHRTLTGASTTRRSSLAGTSCEIAHPDSAAQRRETP